MAAGGERRLVFDVRGRRKHVVRVVYAILSLLMVASLFFVVGPFNLGSLVGRGGTTSAAKVDDEQAERIERRLARDPTNGALLLALTQARIRAGGAKEEVNPETKTPVVTAAAREEFGRALRSWRRYVKQTGSKVSPTGARSVAETYFSLAVSSFSLGEAVSSLEQAATAQRIAAERQPNVGSLSTLAIYEYLSGDFAAGDRAAKQTQRRATSKAEAKSIEGKLAEYRKRGKQIEKQKAQFAKLEKKKSKEKLENPLGSLAGGSSPLGP